LNTYILKYDSSRRYKSSIKQEHSTAIVFIQKNQTNKNNKKKQPTKTKNKAKTI